MGEGLFAGAHTGPSYLIAADSRPGQFTNGEEDYNFDEIGGMDAMHDQFNINMPPQPGAGTLDADGYPILGDYEFGASGKAHRRTMF